MDGTDWRQGYGSDYKGRERIRAMTLRDLILNQMVKDDDKITISRPLCGAAVDMRSGHWFNDRVLDFMNLEISRYSWDEENGYSIALKSHTADAEQEK